CTLPVWQVEAYFILPMRTRLFLGGCSQSNNEECPGAIPFAPGALKEEVISLTCGIESSANPLHRLCRLGPVQFCVDLGHDRGGMAQDGPRRVQAELPPEPGGRVVAELVGVPVGYRGVPCPLGLMVGLSDAIEDGMIV